MKMREWRLVLVVGAAVGVGLVAGVAQSSSGAFPGKKVCMDQFVTAPVISDVVRGMRQGLRASGVTFVLKNSETDAANIQTIVRQFRSSGCAGPWGALGRRG